MTPNEIIAVVVIVGLVVYTITYIITMKQQEDIICNHICSYAGFKKSRVFNFCTGKNCYVDACECISEDGEIVPLKYIIETISTNSRETDENPFSLRWLLIGGEIGPEDEEDSDIFGMAEEIRS